MKTFTPVYIPAGVGTFHMESASAMFAASVGLLREICPETVCPDDMLLSADAVAAFLETVSPDLVIFQNLTFANGAYMSEVLRRYDGPLLLWTLPEPVIDGGRLRLNSLTGAFSAAHTALNFGDRRFSFVYGSPLEDTVRQEISAVFAAAKVRAALRSLRIAAIGQTPQGFGFGRALDTEMQKCFGAELIAAEARELMDRAEKYTDAEAAEYLDKTFAMTCGFENTPEEHRLRHAKLYRAYTEWLRENRVDALASRCWPDFFTAYGTPVCAVLSLLNDDGVAAACEADIYGALSMWIGVQLSGMPAFFGDPVSLDAQANTITFWHCGMSACSLARKDTGAAVGVHPNRKIGPAMDFGCEAWDGATIFRIGRKPDGSFRFFICEGCIEDRPKQFTGTSLVVRTDADSKSIIQNGIREGFEPHFAVIRGRHGAALAALADMLGMEVTN